MALALPKELAVTSVRRRFTAGPKTNKFGDCRSYSCGALDVIAQGLQGMSLGSLVGTYIGETNCVGLHVTCETIRLAIDRYRAQVWIMTNFSSRFVPPIIVPSFLVGIISHEHFTSLTSDQERPQFVECQRLQQSWMFFSVSLC